MVLEIGTTQMTSIGGGKRGGLRSMTGGRYYIIVSYGGKEKGRDMRQQGGGELTAKIAMLIINICVKVKINYLI